MNTRVLNAQPWRFEPGDHVYVRGWPSEDRAVVTALIPTRQGFPSYLIVDESGDEWHMAQLFLSRSPLTTTQEVEG
jgi:hypothetical protein